MIDLNGKRFIALANSENGEVSSETIFNYFQEDKIIWANYSGVEIVRRSLIGKILNSDSFEFVYQHLNNKNELLTGNCTSFPKMNSENKIEIEERWQWTCRDFSTGTSTLIED